MPSLFLGPQQQHNRTSLTQTTRDIRTLTQPLSGLALSPWKEDLQAAVQHQRLQAPLIRQRLLLLGLLCTAGLLSSCSTSSGRTPIKLLRVARIMPTDERVTPTDSSRDRRRLRSFQNNLWDVVPGLRIQPALYSEAAVQSELERQTSSGLGPDLVMGDARLIQQLFEAKLLDPVPVTAEQRNAIAPGLLQRVTNSGGELTGLPVSQYLQLACYDKRKLKEPPTTLALMSKQSGEGQVFGITQNFEDLYWSMSGFKAGNALVSSLRGQQPTAEQNQRLVRWLSWLRDASYQQNVMFLRDQATLRKQLINGQLHWISCWSSQLPQLREAMKDNLGMTLLPAGPAAPATPISKLQVWGLGRNSSRRQRQTAEELMQFIVQPWAQKTWSLRFRTNYPVNPAAATIINRQIPGIKNLYIYTGKEEIKIGDEIVAAIDSNPKLAKSIQNILNDVIFGAKTPAKGAKRLQTVLRSSS